jgi:hypothetical protein
LKKDNTELQGENTVTVLAKERKTYCRTVEGKHNTGEGYKGKHSSDEGKHSNDY